MVKDSLYNIDWDNISGYVKLDEYDIPLPNMPAFSTMENYGVAPEDQYFKRTVVPPALLRRKNCTPEEEAWIEGEYHKIHNGVWYLINGKPIFFTGAYYFFLNYWTTQKNVKPDFLYIQCLIFLFWDMCVRDKDCYGCFLVKPRRIGGTEMTIAMLWLDGMRYRNMVCGMQSKNEDSVYKNYKRIINSHKKMIWFMKPFNQGSTENKEGLFFKYPVEAQTAKQMRELAENGEERQTIYEDEEIGSEITYQPSVATAYDGERLDRYILNEFGKMEKMSVSDCWDKVKPCLHLDNGMVISGKGIFESTIEEINDKQLAELIDFYYASDTNKKDNGRTESGLYRLFINALDAAAPDKYGFPKKKETELFLNQQFDVLKRRGKTKDLGKLRRKTPIFIEDALTPSGNQSAFHTERLQESIDRINFPEEGKENEVQRGNFEWEGGIRFSRVVFQLDENGRWEVSKLQGFEDNLVYNFYGENVPGNIDFFRTGVDPFDHKDTSDSRKSLGASVTFERYNELIDGTKFDIENGLKIPVDGGAAFITNQPVCVYLHRHDDPALFYEDMLMQCIYYGSPILCESQKPGLMRYFDAHKHGKFIMNRPAETMTRTDRGATKENEGIPASEVTINQYFSSISSYVYNYHNAIKFKSLLTQLLSMNRTNVTKHDLGVAFGWCLLAVNADLPSYTDRYSNQEETQTWFQYVPN